jgi:hypothetical protein
MDEDDSDVKGRDFEVKNLGKEIVDLYLDGNNLYVVTENGVKSFLMVGWKSLTR